MKKKLVIDGLEYEIELHSQDADSVKFSFNDKVYWFDKKGEELNHNILDHEGIHTQIFHASSSQIPGLVYLCHNGNSYELEVPTKGRVKKKSDEQGHMLSPMPGKIIKVFKEVGDQVEKGEPILVLEAMKMEHTIKANCNGQIEKIYFEEGQLVDGQVELVDIKENN
ncbi:MAG: hypothetical protein OEY33_03470 [Bdellovibrionales bacterium]|jgi:biotin carboxyl carrier protein|nr:hypothetical protein [Bdellovibrionales bacterium]